MIWNLKNTDDYIYIYAPYLVEYSTIYVRTKIDLHFEIGIQDKRNVTLLQIN